MEESLKSLKWSIHILIIGSLSMTAAVFGIPDSARTVNVMTFPVPTVTLITLAYFVLTVLQAQVYLHLRHIIRLVESDQDTGLAAIATSPVTGIYTGHRSASLGNMLSGMTIWVQLFFLPTVAVGVPTFLSGRIVLLGSEIGWLQQSNFVIAVLFSPLPIAIGIRTARQFQSLCRRASNQAPKDHTRPTA